MQDMHTYNAIMDALVVGNKTEVLRLVEVALKEGLAAVDILENGLSKGMERVGEKFETLELYLPDMMLSAEAMQDAVALLQPYFDKLPDEKQEKRIIMGTVQGDMHDIGKNIVSVFLDISGFKVHDIGINVPSSDFVVQAEEKQASIIGISALMTTTMVYIKDIIDELSNRNLRDKYKVMIGGGSITPEFAKAIGADGYGENFLEAVKVARQLTGPGYSQS